MKIGETVFYVSNGKIAVGTIVRRYDKEKFVIVPLQRGKERALRKKDRIFPVKDYKKYLDI